MKANQRLDLAVLAVAESYLRELDTPRSLATWLMVKHGEWSQLLAQRVTPSNYLEHQAALFERDYLATEFLRKYPALPAGIDRQKVARDAFWAAEAQCAQANVRLAPYIHAIHSGFYSEHVDEGVLNVILEARRLVKDLLRGLPTDLLFRFGPGTTFELRGHPCASNLVLGDKIEHGIASTDAAADLVRAYYYPTAAGRALVRARPYQSQLQSVRGNRFFTVPKDATKDRGCCAEPLGNVGLQLAVGRVLRGKLLHWGIDLSTGQQHHGRLARAASISGDLATIDLSSASDTVARGLIQLLLPSEWYHLLDSLRSPFTRISGKWVRLEKFSSMGNGFTFELETIVFAALARAVGVEKPMVYGDDIIVPTDRSADVLACLRFFGFTPNARKTFTDGLFRESCGTDAFNGVVVRPFRWDSEPETPPDWISVHNGIRRARRWKQSAAGLCARAQIPRALRLSGPTLLGDDVLHDTESRWTVKEEHGIRWVRCLRRQVHSVDPAHFHGETQLAMALYGLPSGPVPTRNVSGFELVWRSAS